MSIKDDLKNDMQEAGKSTNADYFKFESKTTSKLRILTKLTEAPLGQHFFGKGNKPAVCYGIKKGCPFHEEVDGEEPKLSLKYVCYVLDREDGKVKLADMPYTVVKSIGDMEQDDEMKFESYPMPYDVKITYDKDLPPAEMYKVIASPKFIPVSPEEMDLLAEKLEKQTPAEYVQKKKDYQISEHEKSGVRISEEDLANKEAERKAKFNKGVAEHNAKAVDEPTIEYPADEGGDIPF